jgi:hypothetical protein
VTCASPLEPDDPDEPELHAAASATVAATPAAARIFRMYPLFYDRDGRETLRVLQKQRRNNPPIPDRRDRFYPVAAASPRPGADPGRDCVIA